MAITFIGYNEALVLPICSIRIKDQQEIGTAVGVAGSARSAISTVAATIYSVVLTVRLGKTIPAVVPAAVIQAGLPESSVAAYIKAISDGGSSAALAAVKGLTPAIEAVGATAFRIAYLQAYRTIFYTSIGFGGIAILISFLIPNIGKLLTSGVAATVQAPTAKETIADTYHHKNQEAERTIEE